jgi:hypothetical protein
MKTTTPSRRASFASKRFLLLEEILPTFNGISAIIILRMHKSSGNKLDDYNYRTLPLKTRVICAIVESLYYVFICTYFPVRAQHEIDVVSRLNRQRNDVFKPFNVDFTLFAR